MSVEDFARRWMASPHWGGWRKGMQDEETGGTCVSVPRDGVPVFVVEDDPKWLPRRFVNATPDLTHPGTRAFLLEDVRAAWGENSGLTLFEACHMGGPTVRVCVLDTKTVTNTFHSFGDGDPDEGEQVETMAEALILALEAAP